MLIKIPDSKTHTQRTFTIIGETEIAGLNMINIYKKYASLRPKNCSNNRFFLNYRNGKCSVQVVGINTFSKIPSCIAKFLDLKEPGLYTGHCFRRSSASLLVDSGGDILALKRHGGWKSNTVAEGYLEDSLNKKIDCANKILGPSNALPSTSYSSLVPGTLEKESIVVTNNENIKVNHDLKASQICINNASNCTFNINIYKNE